MDLSGLWSSSLFFSVVWLLRCVEPGQRDGVKKAPNLFSQLVSLLSCVLRCSGFICWIHLLGLCWQVVWKVFCMYYNLQKWCNYIIVFSAIILITFSLNFADMKNNEIYRSMYYKFYLANWFSQDVLDEFCQTPSVTNLHLELKNEYSSGMNGGWHLFHKTKVKQ